MQAFWKIALVATLTSLCVATEIASAKTPSDWAVCKASAKKKIADSVKVQQCTAVIDAAEKGDKKANKRLADAYFHRGAAYGGMDQHDKALADFSQAVKLKPKSARIWYHRGNEYADKGLLDQAIGDYDQAIALKPKHARAFASRCRARALANKELETALADCNRSLALKVKDNGRALAARGLVYFRSGTFDKALTDMDQAVAALPKSAGALFIRGAIKIKKNDKTGGNADIAAAKALETEVAKRYATFGIVVP